MNLKQLQRCADALQSASALPLSALISLLNEQPHSADIQTTSTSYLGALVEQLLFHLPVLSIFDAVRKVWVLVNMADFSLAGTGDTFADLLLLGGAESEAVVPQEEAPEMMSTHVRNKPGRHPFMKCTLKLSRTQ